MAIKVRRGKLYPPIDINEGFALGLDELEWEKVVDRLGRPPNHFECSIFAALWSEQVSNKSSASLLETIEREMSEVLSVPGSQIGMVEVAPNCLVALRVASNNQQAFIDPYYGSQTAMDGAIEELSSVGARPLALFNMFRFGAFELIKNQRLFQGVVDGVGAFGTKYGAPILGGDLYFHRRYNGGVMVNSGVVGVARNKNALEVAEVPFRSPILYVGARSGKDGLQYHEDSEDEVLESQKKEKTHIKVSDPLLANRLISACAEAIEKGVLREVIAVGHGGLAVSCFDLSKRINRPILMDIDRIPLRGNPDSYAPLDIILGESSERLLMVTNRDTHRQLNAILYKWDLESVKVGEVNDADGIEFYWNHYLVADIPFQFALEGSEKKEFDVVQFPPMLKRSGSLDDDADKQRKRKRKVVDEWTLIREVALSKEEDSEEREIECPSNLEDIWLDLLANPNLCSRAPMYQMFDQVVGASTVQKPGGDAAVLRLRDLDSSIFGAGTEQSIRESAENAAGNGASGQLDLKGLAVTLDSNSLYVSMEPYLGTVQTVAEAMRNLAATGARPCGLAYCMNFGHPDNYRDVCDLAESIRGLGDSSRIWDIPILSRQIALGNGTEGNRTLPTPSVLMAGIINDLHRSCSIGFKKKGDVILLLGLTENEISCTEYSEYAHRYVNKLVPDIKFDEEKKICDLVVSLIEEGLAASAHDLSGGGLAIALTESCMMRGRPIGATFTIDDQVFESPNGPIPLRRDAALFSETSGRFLVSCSPEDEDLVREKAAAKC